MSDVTLRLRSLIAPVLKRLYPQNPDVVLGREARVIAEALVAAGFLPVPENPAHEQHDYVLSLLDDLVAFSEKHRVSLSGHDHDCFEEWCILRDSAKAALLKAAGGFGSEPQP